MFNNCCIFKKLLVISSLMFIFNSCLLLILCFFSSIANHFTFFKCFIATIKVGGAELGCVHVFFMSSSM
jgi:hypothetical protein